MNSCAWSFPIYKQKGVQQCTHTGILTKRNTFSSGGGVDVWLRRWFCDLEVAGSSVALTTWWGCFLAVPSSASLARSLRDTTNWAVFSQVGWLYVYFHPTIQLEYLQTSWSRLDYCHSLYSQVREESVLGRLAAGFLSFTSLKESLIKSSKLAFLSVKNSSYIAISRQSHKTIPVFWQVMEKFAYNKRHQNNSLWINM